MKTSIEDIDKRIRLAGEELRVFRSDYYKGITIQLVGLAAAGIAFAMSNKVTSSPAVVAGFSGGIMLSGSIVIIVAHRKIGRSGRYLQRSLKID